MRVFSVATVITFVALTACNPTPSSRPVPVEETELGYVMTFPAAAPYEVAEGTTVRVQPDSDGFNDADWFVTVTPATAAVVGNSVVRPGNVDGDGMMVLPRVTPTGQHRRFTVTVTQPATGVVHDITVHVGLTV